MDMEQVENKLTDVMRDIAYGWVDSDGCKHLEVDNQFEREYRLQSPKGCLQTKVGVCWDQVELEREVLANIGVSFSSYFMVYYDGAECPSHTFIIIEYDGKFYWYEHSWYKHRGLHVFDSFVEAVGTIRRLFLEDHELYDSSNFEATNFVTYKYNRPKYGIGCADFYHHCEQSEQVPY